MEDILFDLPNAGLESLESFAVLFFYEHINLTALFYTYRPLQVVSCDPYNRPKS